MAADEGFGIPGVPFPVGVEYYRAPAPKPEVWDEDLARIRSGGFRIVRSFTMWNWMEPRPGQYELDEFDRLFDLAEKHDLYIWLDMALATHGAGPEWMTRDFPDMRVVNQQGRAATPVASAAMPQGSQIHCYDHPLWRRFGGALIEHVVTRYRDRPSLLIWGLWDGIAISSAFSRQTDGLPCYCPHTLARYEAWLRERFTLDELNERLLRRFRRWEDVEPPRSKASPVEMLLYRQFHYENLAGHLEWMIGETKRLDPVHETRTHGAWYPRPWDERCAAVADSWGMSMPSSSLLTVEDPYQVADRAFSFDWSRSAGKHGRWWNEEIYAGMSPGGVTWKKQADPREVTTLLWMTLACGAAGAMFWQYRPEYMSFESPGYNLAALDGTPNARFEAAARAIEQIDGLSEHLPLECPRAEVGVVYHPESQELFGYNDEDDRFLADMRGTYRALWTEGFTPDVVSPRMDWSGYRQLFLPNVALMDEAALQSVRRTLRDSAGARLVAEGSFGMYSADGQSSYGPPDGLAEELGVRVADFSAVTAYDIEQGRNMLETSYGPVAITSPCGYAVLEPRGEMQGIASIEGQTVGVQSADGRFTWYGLTLSAGFGDVGQPDLVRGLTREAAIAPPVAVDGDRVVPIVRRSRQGGLLLFVFNLEGGTASSRLRPRERILGARDLLAGRDLDIRDNGFDLEIPQWDVAVVHCAEG
ncbi:MAG: beta-galactosidase [Chloroflexi bacterium]|nr:beta-galactosidase [Chloroflexota bacterium]